MQFPTLTGSNLNGTSLTLPMDLSLPALAVVAYQRDQQRLVDTWLELVDDLAERGIATYELPTLPSYDPVRRWVIDSGMRSGIPDAAARDRTITLYTDVAAFRRTLGLRDGDVVAVLIDGDGAVVWQAAGARRGRTAGEVTAALAAGRADA